MNNPHLLGAVHDGDYKLSFVGKDRDGVPCVIFSSGGHADLKITVPPGGQLIVSATLPEDRPK